MTLYYETTIFFIFVLIGFVFGIIFDFFRAFRKIKKVGTKIVYIQDIIYFIIIGIILLIAILNIRTEVFRFYLILAMILGVIMYISIIGNRIMNLFFYLFKCSNAICNFIFLPIKLYKSIFNNQLEIIKKYVIRCCKKILYMIKFYHNRINYVVINRNNSKSKEGR